MHSQVQLGNEGNKQERGKGSESKMIVFRVGADPEPRDDFALTDADCSMVLADSDDTDAVSPFLEFQRWMERVFPPERVFLARESLDRGRQCVEVLPEPSLRSANHGRSCRRPARMSARTSSATEWSRPSAAKSLSIWRSQAALSRSRMKAASSVSSSGESASTAVFISVRLTAEMYSRRGENAMLRCDGHLGRVEA